jgi:hypothetical protein
MLQTLLSKLGLGKKSVADTINTTNADSTVRPTFSEIEAENNLYDFPEIPFEEMQNHPDAINDMYTGKIDGFLIKNVLSHENADKLLDKLMGVKSDKNKLANVPEGFTYPTVFAEYSIKVSKLPVDTQTEEVKKYFINNELFNNEFAKEFGVDTRKIITDFFTSVAGGREVKVPNGIEDIGQYPFATFRYLVPEQGLMSVHCGNYFGQTFEKFYSHLNTKVATKDQMSFFIMLQEPEEGGELSLFNFRWEDGQTKVSAVEDNEVIQPDGSKVYVQTDPSIRKNKLRPRKGDMILFQGGNIWHRVERIKGTIPRITYGGFLSLSYDEKTIYFWS